MSKCANQKLKLLYLKKIFEEYTDDDHGLTMTELINKLSSYGVQAERKSIYADMEQLRLFGIDIETRKTRTYEYYIANRTFELPELKLLVDAVQSSKFITLKKSNRLIKKMSSLVSVHQARQLQRQVYVTNRTKHMNEGIYYNVDKIQSGILQNKKITFQYFEWSLSEQSVGKVIKKIKKDGQLYQISPWTLTWDDENYYMIGYDSESEKIKHYRVDKMMKINLSAKAREGQQTFETFDIGTYTKMTFGMFGGQQETVKLRFNNRLIGVVVDRFGTDVHIVPDDTGSFTVTLTIMLSPPFYAWIFGLGEDVEILSPSSVIEAFNRQITEIQEKYQTP